MQHSDRLASRQVVLLGIGHTNAHVLRMWGMHRYPDAALTCISDYTTATYSGFLPAVLAQQIRPAQMEIDLVRLCSSVGARLITNRVTGLDTKQRHVQFADRPPIPFDVLSVGIGSKPTMKGVLVEGESLLTIKPMQSFLRRLDDALTQRLANHPTGQSLRIAIVGAGVAGVEITCCLPPFLEAKMKESGAHQVELSLITKADEILPGMHDGTRRRVLTELNRRGVNVVVGRRVVAVRSDKIAMDPDETREADLVIWATGASAPPLLDHLNLPLDDRGFLATRDTLQTVADLPVFAVGDTGGMVNRSLPKSGVYAVRQGPVLWQNLRRQLDGRPLQKYRPQSTFMRLINLGDGRAVGQWRGISFEGKWVMRWKQHIDQKFMDKFVPKPMEEDADNPMQCRGCGCKLGGVSLDAVLEDAAGTSNIVKDDAAEIGDEANPMVASTDFFTTPFDDAYLSGRVAALHSASDLVAMGANVRHALANVVLPEGKRREQEQVLRDFLAGANAEFALLGASIVGGHTTVGPRMEVGFTVVGKPWGDLIRKANLKDGDMLMLTKPLGIGVLLAAHMRAACHARDYEALVSAMLAPQHQYANAAVQAGIDAGTDVTGFGLGGHLLEMLEASGLAATLQLDQVPLLPGAAQALSDGIESSLAPDNHQLLASVGVDDALRRSAAFKSLADPQTCGGLLLGVASNEWPQWQKLLEAEGLPLPSCIGAVHLAATGKPLLRVAS